MNRELDLKHERKLEKLKTTFKCGRRGPMKKFIMASAVVIGALALTACQSTSNSGSGTNAASSTCVNGVMTVNGITVSCSGTGVIGGGGLVTGVGGQTAGGCTTYNNQYWSLYYSNPYYYAAYSPTYVYYVPVMGSNGVPYCQNIGQQNYTNIVNMYSGYGYNYNGTTPIYYCPTGNYNDCYGDSQYGYGGNYSSGLGLCFGFGDDVGNVAGVCI